MSICRWTIVPSKGALTSLNCVSAESRSTSACCSITCARAAFSSATASALAAFFEFAFLIRYDAFGRFPPTFVGSLGEIGLGLLDGDLGDAGVQFRLRGKQFGVEIGRIDRRQSLSGLYVIADIDTPFGDIAVHPRIDRRIVPRCGFAWKREGLRRWRQRGGDRVDDKRLRGVLARRISQFRVCLHFLMADEKEAKTRAR